MVNFLILAFLVILNGIFAMSEIALVSSRRMRLEKLAKQGNKRAAAALKLAADPQRFLPTVQVGMTAVSIVGEPCRKPDVRYGRLHFPLLRRLYRAHHEVFQWNA